MITRANIRRQLRASGGITNAVPRQQYGLGSFVKKAFKKVGNVAKQVVKSPLGKAALIGLGGAGLMGYGPMSGALGGFGKSMFGNFASQLGPITTKGSGLLGLLGKGRNALGNMSGLTKMLGAGGLLGYFASKGASEEEAQSLAADVKRGAGMGFDQIKKDIAAYRGGGQDESQMAAKGYRFLTPKKFTQPFATGGRVGLKEGSKSISSSGLKEAKKDYNKVHSYHSGGDPIYVYELYSGGFDEFLEINKKDYKAEGGRVGLQAGNPEEGIKSLEAGASSIKVEGDVRPPEMKMQEEMKMAEIPKNLSAADAVRTFELSEGRKPKDMQEVIEFFKNRKLSAMGGIMDMPTGNMRRNKAGIKEIDYRATGGFVPVGIKEKADDVPAMLSKNEFVMTADAVRGAGNGSIKKGAQRMYDLMKQNESKVV